MQYSKKLIHFDSSSHLEQLNDYVVEYFNHYTHQQLLSTLHHETYYVQWHCYECKKQIDVDIRPFTKRGTKFNSENLFCSNHREKAQRSMRSHVFVRYENSFYNMIKAKMLDTTLIQFLNA